MTRIQQETRFNDGLGTRHNEVTTSGNRHLNIRNSSGGPNRVNRAHWPTKENRLGPGLGPGGPAGAHPVNLENLARLSAPRIPAEG